MASVRARFGTALVVAVVAAIIAACGNGDGPGEGPSLRLTDPATVPTATPASEQRIFRFEGGIIVPPSGSPTAGPTAPPTTGRTYTVQPGDTCISIAEALGVTVEALRNANPGIDPGCTNLQPGQDLVVPGASAPAARATPTPTGAAGTGGRTHTIQPGDTCYDIARTYGVDLQALISLNGLDCQALQPGPTIRIP